MKLLNNNIKPIVFILAAGTVLWATACQKQLDKSPLTQFASEDFWKSENDVMLALAGVYRGNITGDLEQSPSDWWSYYGMQLLDMATDNLYDRRGDNSAINRLTNGTLVASNGHVAGMWSASYKRIARCNYFLENMVRAQLAPDKAKRLTAEARFIRACTYFYMSQFWGAVPLVTKTLTVEEANTVAKAPKADIVKFVTDELEAAAADLPRAKDLPASELGRATTQAALAFLGRMQLSEKNYPAAAAVYKTIIDQNDNVIDPDYQSLFNGANETSREHIFSIQFVENLLKNGMLQHYLPRVSGGFHLVNPLGSLAESYEFTDGTPFSFTDPRYNAKDPAMNRDPRFKYTILYNGQMTHGQQYLTHPDSAAYVDQLTLTKQATRTGFCIRKGLPEAALADPNNSGINLPVIRYAEVLLSYLEAKLEAGDAIDQALLDATINKVRGRASVGMPAVTELDPARLRVILRRERRVEMACEGTRYWDLLRWGIAGQVLKGDFYGCGFPGAINIRKKNAAAPVDPYGRWYVTSKAFRTGQDELWPIPQGEMDINPNLK